MTGSGVVTERHLWGCRGISSVEVSVVLLGCSGCGGVVLGMVTNTSMGRCHSTDGGNVKVGRHES